MNSFQIFLIFEVKLRIEKEFKKESFQIFLGIWKRDLKKNLN